MSYTTNRQPQGILKNNETFLREGLISELVAINDYSHFLSLTDHKDLRDIFYHIMKEEKEHYGLFLEALRMTDKEEDKLANEVNENLNISTKNNYRDYSGGNENRNLLLTYIREAIKGELEAIILYNNFLDNIDNKELSVLIKSIAKDEKEHTEELTKALVILDRDEYGPIKF